MSAILDDENPGLSPAELDDHLAGCAACRGWRESAAAVTRLTRLAPAAPTPDVTAAVLARAPLPRPSAWPGRLRWLLGLVSVGQLAVGAAQLLAPPGMAGHLSHETGAFNVALAVALMWVALKPGLAATQLPVLGSFVGVLVLAIGVDLLDGEVGWSRLATHVPVVIGLLCTALLRRYGWPSLGPSGRASAPETAAVPGAPAASHPAGDRPDQHRSPAAEHRRAA